VLTSVSEITVAIWPLGERTTTESTVRPDLANSDAEYLSMISTADVPVASALVEFAPAKGAALLAKE